MQLDVGPDAALDVARAMVVPRHRAGGQAQYLPETPTAAGDAVGQALAWAASNPGTAVTASDLAAQAHVSVRTLHRHCLTATGLAPLEWLIQQRVHVAAQLL